MNEKTALLLSAIVLLTLAASANAFFPIIDLGPGKAYSINDSGQIVGQSNNYACIFEIGRASCRERVFGLV
jgi:hypothetical protein